MERPNEKDRSSARTDATPPADGKSPRAEPLRLDLEKLDLTVEEVEERIRPGETNVFDK